MKKVLIVFFLIISLTYSSTNVSLSEPTDNAAKGIPYKYTPTEGTVEELYKDIIVTLLEPYITDEITRRYGTLLQYDLFNVEFLKIERSSYRSLNFLIKLQVKPFVGAHNTIGIDEITIRVSPVKTKIEEFEHIKSFPPPPHLKKYYKDLKL